MTDKAYNPKASTSPLQVNNWFLSRAEHSFFQTARKVLGERFVLCPQVALGAVFALRDGQANDPAFERIWCKWVDFVVCDAVSINILYGIELDEDSDQSPAAVERRELLRRVFASVELPLLQLEAAREYSPRELGALFEGVLKTPRRAEEREEVSPFLPEIGVREARPEPPPLPQVCPNCGSPFKIKVSKAGPNVGKEFYVCSRYPECKTHILIE